MFLSESAGGLGLVRGVVVDSGRQCVETERMDGEEALGNNQGFSRRIFSFNFCPKDAVAKYAAAVIDKTRVFGRR